MRKNKVRMMTKNKIILIIFASILFFTIISYPILGQALTDPTLNPDYWGPNVQNDSQLTEKVGNVLGIINVVGVVVAVIVLMVLGIKYMLHVIYYIISKEEYTCAIII